MKIPNCPECRAVVREKAQAFLREFLISEKKATEVLAAAGAEGFSKRQILEASLHLQVTKFPISHPDGEKGIGWWVWKLPTAGQAENRVRHICAREEETLSPAPLQS